MDIWIIINKVILKTYLKNGKLTPWTVKMWRKNKSLYINGKRFFEAKYRIGKILPFLKSNIFWCGFYLIWIRSGGKVLYTKQNWPMSLYEAKECMSISLFVRNTYMLYRLMVFPLDFKMNLCMSMRWFFMWLGDYLISE